MWRKSEIGLRLDDYLWLVWSLLVKKQETVTIMTPRTLQGECIQGCSEPKVRGVQGRHPRSLGSDQVTGGCLSCPVCLWCCHQLDRGDVAGTSTYAQTVQELQNDPHDLSAVPMLLSKANSGLFSLWVVCLWSCGYPTLGCWETVLCVCSTVLQLLTKMNYLFF